jgi:hypothetical protein
MSTYLIQVSKIIILDMLWLHINPSNYLRLGYPHLRAAFNWGKL